MLAQLLQRQLNESLERVEACLARWRSGELGPFEAHAEVLKHTVRTERMAGHLVQTSKHDAKPVLRDALDAGLIEREEFIDLAGTTPEDVEPAGSLNDAVAMPHKRDFVRDLLDRGPILVHVDARSPGVSVPARLQDEPKLVLRYGYSLSPPIHDLTVDDRALAGTLTFGGVPHHCVLPWMAVYAVVSEADQRGMVWPEDVPEDVLAEMASEGDLPPSGPIPTRSRAAPSKPAAKPAPQAGKSAKRRASHLKLVD